MTNSDEQLAKTLRALADPARLRLLRLILRERSGLDPRCSSRSGVCFCHLKEAMNLAPATISHHLKVLRQAGLIQGIREGRWTYYRAQAVAADAVMRSLAELLYESTVDAQSEQAPRKHSSSPTSLLR